MDQADHGVGRRIQGLGIPQRGLGMLCLIGWAGLVLLPRDALGEAGYSRESAEQLGYVTDGLTLREKQQLG